MPGRNGQAEFTLRDASDRELAQRSGAGSVGAFGELVRRFEHRLFNFIRQRTANEHDAEDITQEAFLRAWRHIGRYDERWQFSTWLFTIAARHAIDVNNKRRPVLHGQTAAEHVPTPDLDPAAQTAQADERRNLWDLALTVLNEQERSVLWLRYAEVFDARAIGRIVGKSTINVRVILHRSLRKLQLSVGHEKPEKPGQVRFRAGEKPGQVRFSSSSPLQLTLDPERGARHG